VTRTPDPRPLWLRQGRRHPLPSERTCERACRLSTCRRRGTCRCTTRHRRWFWSAAEVVVATPAPGRGTST